LKIFSLFRIFEQLCAYHEKQSLPWNFSLYRLYFLHSGFLSNLRLPWKTESALYSLYWIYIFTVTWGEVRGWGGTVSFKAKFASVWIERSSINSPLNWLLAEWLLLMLSTPYHNLLHTHRYRGDSRFEKKGKYRRAKLKRLVTYLFNGFTEKLKQSSTYAHVYNGYSSVFQPLCCTEPSANVCFARRTLCNDPSVYIAITAKNCGCEFPPRKIRSVSAEPLAANRGALGFLGTPVEKHWHTVIQSRMLTISMIVSCRELQWNMQSKSTTARSAADHQNKTHQFTSSSPT